jgi:hypothetical protein
MKALESESRHDVRRGCCPAFWCATFRDRTKLAGEDFPPKDDSGIWDGFHFSFSIPGWQCKND